MVQRYENLPRMYKRFIVPLIKVFPGYTARWIGNPEGMPKYYNQQPKNNFVYGLDSQTKDKNVVIVTEGQCRCYLLRWCCYRKQ